MSSATTTAAIVSVLITAVLIPLAAILISLPRRIANWKIRESYLKGELTRIGHERDRAIAQLDVDQRDQRQEITGTGTYVVIRGSQEEQDLGDIARRADAARDRTSEDAERESGAIQRELEANWITHMFADQCQGGRQVGVLRHVLPQKQQQD